jgi:hypothetical protein
VQIVGLSVLECYLRCASPTCRAKCSETLSSNAPVHLVGLSELDCLPTVRCSSPSCGTKCTGMPTQDAPVPGEVVEVVHDDCDEEVEDEEAAHHEEADEVEVRHVRPAPLALQI